MGCSCQPQQQAAENQRVGQLLNDILQQEPGNFDELLACIVSLTASIEPPDDRVNRATQRFAEGSNVCGF